MPVLLLCLALALKAAGEETEATPPSSAAVANPTAERETPHKNSKPAKGSPQKPSPQSSKAQAERERTESEIRTLKELIFHQEHLITQQQEALKTQAEAIEDLQQRLAKLEAVAKAALDRLQEVEQKPPQPNLSAAIEERLKKLEEDVRKLPEATDVVSVGDFPGSFRIPGTDAALKIGGQVRVTAVFSLDAIGSDDRFVTSSIPIEGTEAAGKGSRTTLSASPSRFNFDFRTPTGIGAMRAFIEAGFTGSGATLRHAFGQWGHFILGQTWSTFSDPEAEPFGIDNEGLNAISLFRQPQIRYTTDLKEGVSFSAAIENPAPDVTNASGVNQLPDFIFRIRWIPKGRQGGVPLLGQLGHLQLAVLMRQIRAEPYLTPNETVATGGYGLGVSGRLRTGWWGESDDVTFSAYAGKGIGRYITDLRAAGGQDAYFNLDTGELTALGDLAAYVGYEHAWSKTLRSTLTLGWVWVDVLPEQPDDSLKYTRRFSLNFAWSPIPRLDLVGEVLTGTRIDKDLRSGAATQVQLGSRFRF